VPKRIDKYLRPLVITFVSALYLSVVVPSIREFVGYTKASKERHPSVNNNYSDRIQPANTLGGKKLQDKLN